MSKQDEHAVASKPKPEDDVMPTVTHVATGKKLAMLLEGFSPFEESMRHETVSRRTKDAAKVAAMKAEMARLESLLEANARAQQSGNEAVQLHCETHLANAHAGFDSLVAHQMSKAHERLGALEKRADDVEASFALEKARILSEIAARSAELSRLLDAFQESFERERESRVLREADIHVHIQKHATQADAAFAVETAARISAADEIRAELQHVISSRTSADSQLRNACVGELQRLNADLDAEVRQRELSDDDIVKSLNAYTNKLQQSLQIINNPNA
ncbi:SF-assemblin/beta giardin-domain-containing protein [Pelagophyceae sp. CCMP2097]|nr:SF-assemblin/beta giardin-domain-containing protein [Pelagophyceae sp. CCMP2097]